MQPIASLRRIYGFIWGDFLPLPLYIFFIGGKNSPSPRSPDRRKHKNASNSECFAPARPEVSSLLQKRRTLLLIGAMPVIIDRICNLALAIGSKFLSVIPGEAGFRHSPWCSINSKASDSSRLNMLRLEKFASLAVALLTLGMPARAAFDFQKEILPIFQSSCAACHLGDAAQGKLHLGSEAEILQGGASGPAVVPGKKRRQSAFEASARAHGCAKDADRRDAFDGGASGAVASLD